MKPRRRPSGPDQHAAAAVRRREPQPRAHPAELRPDRALGARGHGHGAPRVGRLDLVGGRGEQPVHVVPPEPGRALGPEPAQAELSVPAPHRERPAHGLVDRPDPPHVERRRVEQPQPLGLGQPHPVLVHQDAAAVPALGRFPRPDLPAHRVLPRDQLPGPQRRRTRPCRGGGCRSSCRRTPRRTPCPSATAIPCGTSHRSAPGSQSPAHIAWSLPNRASSRGPYDGARPRTSAYATGPQPSSSSGEEAAGRDGDPAPPCTRPGGPGRAGH